MNQSKCITWYIQVLIESKVHSQWFFVVRSNRIIAGSKNTVTWCNSSIEESNNSVLGSKDSFVGCNSSVTVSKSSVVGSNNSVAWSKTSVAGSKSSIARRNQQLQRNIQILTFVSDWKCQNPKQLIHDFRSFLVSMEEWIRKEFQEISYL